MFKHGISTLLMLAAACCTAAETARLVAALQPVPVGPDAVAVHVESHGARLGVRPGDVEQHRFPLLFPREGNFETEAVSLAGTGLQIAAAASGMRCPFAEARRIGRGGQVFFKQQFPGGNIGGFGHSPRCRCPGREDGKGFTMAGAVAQNIAD